MENDSNSFEEKVKNLISEYGKLDFLEQALEKQKVTRQLLNRAKFKLTSASIFFHSVSILVIIFGVTGMRNSNPVELTFLIPLGMVMFWVVRNHAKKSRRALKALSRFSDHKVYRI